MFIIQVRDIVLKTTLCFGLAVSLWLATPLEGSSQTKIISHETSGNLEVTTRLECAPVSKLNSSHTPADLYAGVAKCFKEENYDHATQMFALAGAYGRFDEQRVSDTSAHQAIQVLHMQTFQNINSEMKDKFQDRVREFLSVGAPKLGELCSEIRKLGAPTYFPWYMIQHGMEAFGPEQPNRGLVPDFSATEAWAKSLDTYLHCPVK